MNHRQIVDFFHILAKILKVFSSEAFYYNSLGYTSNLEHVQSAWEGGCRERGFISNLF